jgi:hypothetical protein
MKKYKGYASAVLLGDPDKKRQAWEDFKKIGDRLKYISNKSLLAGER